MLGGVDPKALLDELLSTCRMLGLVVRDEPMKVPTSRLAGGLVRLHGTPVVIVDSSAPVIDRVAAVADAICEHNIDPIHLSADARRAISHARARRKRARSRLRNRRTETASHWKASQLLRTRPTVSRCRDTDQES
jgi:hypothetical protein